MAVTGRGTETNPWIVATYEEIKECFLKATDDDGGTNTYIKLKDGTTIDCNKYGAAWEWTTVKTHTQQGETNLNLNGGTIKNMVIAARNSLFEAMGYRKIKIYSDVTGGKILNVFCNRAKSIMCGRNVTLENISMSVDASTVEERAFDSVEIQSCAMYIRTNKISDYSGGMNRGLIFVNLNEIKNSDLLFEVDDINQGILINCSSDYSVSDTRIRGYVKGTVNPSALICGRRIQNCVVSMSSEQTVTYLAGNSSTGSTGVYNSTLLNNYNLAHNSGLLAANENQIKNGEWLNNNGFICVQE